MRVGILWTDGEITDEQTIENAMRRFINGRRWQAELGGFGSVRLMGARQGAWAPLEPSREQIQKCLQVAHYMAILFEEQKSREIPEW